MTSIWTPLNTGIRITRIRKRKTGIRDRIQPVFSLNTGGYGKNTGFEYGSRITRMRIRDSRITRMRIRDSRIRIRRIRIPVFKVVQILVIRDPYSVPVFIRIQAEYGLNTTPYSSMFRAVYIYK